MIDQAERSALGGIFDRTFRSLTGRPDVVGTRPTTVQSVHPILELTETFIVQTFRTKESGDTVFVQYIGKDGSLRLALPPDVADTIARQRDALGTKNRRIVAKRVAAERKAAGIAPGFLKNPGQGRKKRKAVK